MHRLSTPELAWRTPDGAPKRGDTGGLCPYAKDKSETEPNSPIRFLGRRDKPPLQPEIVANRSKTRALRGIGILIQQSFASASIVIVFPVFLLYAKGGLVDTYFGLIILYTAFNLPYVVWVMRGYIQDIPLELEESALVDGCTRWQVFVRVVWPMARSGLFATAVFTFVFAWNEFIFALVLTRSAVTTFPVQVTHYFGGQSNFWAKIAAMSVLGTVPIFIAVTLLQRYLVRGISLGAVKG